MNPIQFTVKQIAGILQGKIIGDENVTIHGIVGIEKAGKHDVSFVSNKKYERFLETTNAGCVIVDDSINEKLVEKCKSTVVKVKNSYLAITILLTEYDKLIRVMPKGISENTFIDKSVEIDAGSCFVGIFSHIGPNSKIGKNTQIYAQVYIGKNVKIGENCIIYPGVKIMDGSQIGNRVIIQPGAVIGGDGFGFAPKEDGSFMKIPQIGIVVIEDDVEIGANTTVDRAALEKTILHTGVKLDNLIQIAHNVTIGKHTVMASQVGIAGSTKIGAYCFFGGQAGVVGHTTVANHCSVASQTGVMTNFFEDNTKISGTPSMKSVEYGRMFVYQKKLKSLFEKVEEMEKQLAELKKQ